MLLTINTGSSSIRLDAFTLEGAHFERIASGHYKNKEDTPTAALQEFLQAHHISGVEAIAHRIVQGGAHLTASCIINAGVEAEIEHLSSLAPLHNPLALSWIRACRDILGEQVPQLAVFDTAFYTSLPDVAATYALSRNLCRRYHIKRFGFHGLAHQAMWRRWHQLRPELEKGGRVISMQLGAGCSITAVDQGRPKDTSMGFSPLEGLVMATRSGDLDPGLITYLQRVEGLTSGETEQVLNEASGLLGMSGISSDMSILLKSDNSDARLAVALYCYRACKYIGAYLSVLGGAEAILFGGGVGENAPSVREKILSDMEWCGIQIDKLANAAAIGRESCISDQNSRIEIWVVPVDEAIILAKEAIAVIEKTEGDHDKQD